MTNFRYVGQAWGSPDCSFFCCYVVFKASQSGSTTATPNFGAMEMTLQEVHAARDNYGTRDANQSVLNQTISEMPLFLRHLGLTGNHAYEAYDIHHDHSVATAAQLERYVDGVIATTGNSNYGIILSEMRRETDRSCTTGGHVIVVWPPTSGNQYWVYDPWPLGPGLTATDHLSLQGKGTLTNRLAVQHCTRRLVHPYVTIEQLNHIRSVL